MYYLRLLLALLGFLVASAYGLAITLLRSDRSRVASDYGRALARFTGRPLGVRRVEVHGEDNLRAKRPCIYVINHQSIADVPVLGGIFPENTVVIAKKEIRKIPVFGWLYAATGNIFIDRSQREQAVHQLKLVAEEIRRRGVSVWIFPEGTRSREPGRILPFKKGAFQMAIAAQCPLVPVVASPIRPVLDSSTRTIRPGAIEVRVLEPIPTDGLTEADVDRLVESTHRSMQRTLTEMANRRDLTTGSSVD
jgi:lysophosphatidate acyltransferase